MEVDRLGEKLVKDPENSLPSLLVTINDIFSNLEASIGHLQAMCQVTMNIRLIIFHDYPCGDC